VEQLSRSTTPYPAELMNATAAGPVAWVPCDREAMLRSLTLDVRFQKASQPALEHSVHSHRDFGDDRPDWHASCLRLDRRIAVISAV
jgi:hypothetical protein